MENMVNVYFFGKKYSVPADLTIMTAMEYAGYTLKRGCGCRHGFCGACATIYRIKGKNELKTCLACQTQVEEGMYVLPDRQENIRYRRDPSGAESDDGSVSGDLQLHRMQRMYKGMYSGPERNAVHRLRTARRFREMCGRVL